MLLPVLVILVSPPGGCQICFELKEIRNRVDCFKIDVALVNRERVLQDSQKSPKVGTIYLWLSRMIRLLDFCPLVSVFFSYASTSEVRLSINERNIVTKL